MICKYCQCELTGAGELSPADIQCFNCGMWQGPIFLSYTDIQIDKIKKLEILLNPRLWTEEMHRAWHQALPDIQAAFEALRKVGGMK